jgi:hypothetical protein
VKKILSILSVLVFALSVAVAGPPQGSVTISNDSPEAGEFITVEGKHFRSDLPLPLVTIFCSIGHSWQFVHAVPEKNGKFKVEMAFPQFDPITGRDLSDGASCGVYERVFRDGSFFDDERDRFDVTVGG